MTRLFFGRNLNWWDAAKKSISTSPTCELSRLDGRHEIGLNMKPILDDDEFLRWECEWCDIAVYTCGFHTLAIPYRITAILATAWHVIYTARQPLKDELLENALLNRAHYESWIVPKTKYTQWLHEIGWGKLTLDSA